MAKRERKAWAVIDARGEIAAIRRAKWEAETIAVSSDRVVECAITWADVEQDATSEDEDGKD